MSTEERVVHVDDNGYPRRLVYHGKRLARIEGQSRLDARVDALASAVAQLAATNAPDDWRLVDGKLISQRRIGALAAYLGVTWPVNVEWMTDEQAAEHDAREGGYVAGLRAPSHDCTHTIVLRMGRSASDTASTLRHELVHCGKQVERLGNEFDATYLANRTALEAEAVHLGAAAAHIEVMRDA